MARRRRNSYSSFYKNPYGRTYRRPKTFKTLFKHIAQDSIDSAIYNQFDSPERKYLEELKKRNLSKAKSDLEFLKKDFSIELKITEPVFIKIDKSNYLDKAPEIIKWFTEITDFKLSIQKELYDYKTILEDINPKLVAKIKSNKNFGKNGIFFIGILLALILSDFFVAIGALVIYYIMDFYLKSKYEKEIKSEIEDKINYVNVKSSKVDNIDLTIDFTLEESLSRSYNVLINGFEKVSSCDKIWDILTNTSNETDPEKYQLREVQFEKDSPSDIICDSTVLHLNNKDGADFYFYPLFILAFDKDKIGYLDYRDVFMKEEEIEKLETSYYPAKDFLKVGERWEKQNKDGSPNKRYKDNRMLPIVRYLKFDIADLSELDETYLFSNIDKGKEFINSFRDYKEILTELIE